MTATATEFTVRPATAADAAAIARHRAEMYRDMGELDEALHRPLVDATRRYVEEAIPAGRYVAWLASPSGQPSQVVAGAGMQLRERLPRPNARGGPVAAFVEGLIVNVYTEREWRRRGAAELLVREAIRWARANGVSSIVLHASRDGRSLYERLGFVPTTEMAYKGA
jgi:GNAT superfamily N-acetyltransferase